MTWRVTDCPEHPSCALDFPAGRLCLACGRRVLETLDGIELVPAPSELRSQAKEAWNANQGVRDFMASAREKYPREEPA